jgi:hypothetical protein
VRPINRRGRFSAPPWRRCLACRMPSQGLFCSPECEQQHAVDVRRWRREAAQRAKRRRKRKVVPLPEQVV